MTQLRNDLAAQALCGMKPLAVIRHWGDLRACYRARVAALNTTHEDIEAAARMPVGYLSKVIAVAGDKEIGPLTFGPLNTVLGIHFVAIEEPSWRGDLPVRQQKRHDARGKMLAVKRKRKRAHWRRTLGPMVRHARAIQLLASTPNQRVALARRAARARWSKPKPVRLQRGKPGSSGIAAPAAGAWPVAPAPKPRRARSAGIAAAKARLLPR